MFKHVQLEKKMQFSIENTKNFYFICFVYLPMVIIYSSDFK